MSFHQQLERLREKMDRAPRNASGHVLRPITVDYMDLGELLYQFQRLDQEARLAYDIAHPLSLSPEHRRELADAILTGTPYATTLRQNLGYAKC